LQVAANCAFFSAMTSEETALITGLYDRLAQAGNQQQDSDAARLIQEKVAANPLAPYLLTQSTLVLQQAVTAAQNRIATLEKQLAQTAQPQTGGSFLSGVASLFDPPQPPPAPRPTTPPPIPQQPIQAQGGGGFLQGALATAAGVAGGALLFQGIESLLGHSSGPFGAMGSGMSGGFLGQNQPIVPTETVNNYYGDTGSQDLGSQSDIGNLDQDDVVDNSNPFDSLDGDDDFSGGDDGSSFV